MKEIALDLVRATEAAAIAASAWIGSGAKESADQAATEAMRARLNQTNFSARVAIGEGRKDHSAGLFEGERVGRLAGKGKPGRTFELAVDPIDGTRPTVTSGPEAMSVIAVAEEGALFTTREFYMNKLAYGPEIASKVELQLGEPISRTIHKISVVTGKEPPKIMVCLLDRPRHAGLISELRELGVRIKLIQDCDISGAIACCLPESGIDLLCGVGGAAEGVITACAMKCLKGGFTGQVVKPDGTQPDSNVYGIDELARGDCGFAATGVTDGSLLRGVRFTSRGPVTSSVLMRSESGTVRWMTAHHGN